MGLIQSNSSGDEYGHVHEHGHSVLVGKRRKGGRNRDVEKRGGMLFTRRMTTNTDQLQQQQQLSTAAPFGHGRQSTPAISRNLLDSFMISTFFPHFQNPCLFLLTVD